MSDWASQISQEAAKYRTELLPFMDLINGNTALGVIRDSVITAAAEKSLNAAYGGEWSDGGARHMVREFVTFLEGVRFAETGHASSFQGILDQHRRERDPEYKKYLELKAKFGDNEKK